MHVLGRKQAVSHQGQGRLLPPVYLALQRQSIGLSGPTALCNFPKDHAAHALRWVCCVKWQLTTPFVMAVSAVVYLSSSQISRESMRRCPDLLEDQCCATAKLLVDFPHYRPCEA